MASVSLGTKAVGSIVKLKVGGAARNFIVVHQGQPSSLYDASCNGTWLLMEDCYEVKVWNTAGDGIRNMYSTSFIHSYLNNNFLKLFETNIQNAIKPVKIPYHTGYGGSVQSGGNGLSCKIFLLSGYEVGFTTAIDSYFPVDGAKLSYFESGTGTSANNKRIAYLKSYTRDWYTRSPNLSGGGGVWTVTGLGKYGSGGCMDEIYGIRPALILPSNLFVSDDGTVTTNTAPTTPASITIPQSIMGGSTITVQWGTSTDAESNLAGYKVEKSTNGGNGWSQIYQGTATSTTDAVAFGTTSVMYRVKAYDSAGLESGYRASSQVTVVNNMAPGAPPSITVPNTVTGGEQLLVSWTKATDSDDNLSGYELERQVDGNGWANIYTGPNLSFTDSIVKGWGTVTYRVRAYDMLNARSDYTTSPVRTVNNNTAPVITCDKPSGTDLGTKTEGFSISYTVNDADGDAVTVTEAIDGVPKRTFQAALKQQYSFQVTGGCFQRVLNGKHTMAVTANDGKASSVHTLTFSKEVTKAAVTLDAPMEADDRITICALSVAGFIPSDAGFKVEVTNNAKDEEPAWEDCTAEVKSGANHIFENQEAANGFAFNFRVTAGRGDSGVGGYITSVQGGFQ